MSEEISRLLEKISKQSNREHSFAVMSPLSKLHIWWGRKPLTASRAAILLTLIPEDVDKDKLARILGLHSKDAWKFSPLRERRLREQLREWFRETTGSERPLFVDPMAGGGSIPFEALRLGCRVIAGDYNPVAWLILKATLEYPVEYGEELLGEMRGFFAEVRRELERRVGGFYGGNDRSYVWVKWIRCPGCGLRIPCTTCWWLLRRRGKPEESYVILPDVPEGGDEVEFDVVRYSEVKDEFDPTEGTAEWGLVVCPRCGEKLRQKRVRSLFRPQFDGEHPEDRPFVRAYLAAVVEGSGRKRRYRVATERDLERFERAREELFERWGELIVEDLVPIERIPEGWKTRGLRLKGIDRFYKLFNERQLLVHAELLRVIRELSEGLDEEYREPLTVYTMITFDKMICYNTICSQWKCSRGVIGGIFDYYSYAWSWNHGEMNVLVEGGGWDWAAPNVLEAYEGIVKLLRGVEEKPEVVLWDAKNLPDHLERLGVEDVDAIVVDPPGSDNYAEFADFFYVWLKRSPVAEALPEGFQSELTPKEDEVVANPVRQEDPEEEYERLLRESFKAMREALSRNGRLSVFTTSPDRRGWDILGRALVGAGLQVIRARPVWADGSECFWVLVCEPVDPGERARISVDSAIEMVRNLHLELEKTTPFKRDETTLWVAGLMVWSWFDTPVENPSDLVFRMLNSL